MKTRLLLAVALAVASLAFAFSNVGCSSSSGSTTPGTDGGTGGDSSAADTGGSMDSSMADSGDDAGDLPVSCENYCTLAMLNCTGQNKVYVDKQTCLDMCAHMEPGMKPDMMNDTVACRQYHATAAAATPAFHCPHAGSTGADTCGTSHCKAWCALDIAQCGTVAYPDQQTCETACAGLTYTQSAGDIATISGNTMNCRIYHIEAAYQNGGALKTTHCPHTGVPSINMDNTPGPCH
jgi:hypothetical protein